MHTPPHFVRSFALIAIVFSSHFMFSQTTWNTAGNTTNNNTIFGTLNNQPLIFYTNGVETMRLKANGELRVNNLSGTGNNFVFSNSNGVFYTRPFTADTNKFMTEAGVFRTASSFTGWKMVGQNIHSVNGTFVGIGNINPQYILDVNGDVHFNGIVNAMGINIVNQLQADTIKGATLIKVNNTLFMTGGTQNNIYTSTGDLRLQCTGAYVGNTLLNTGNGNVGVGIFSPQYKLDVNGDVRVSGRMYIQRIVPMPGDSEIHFGDSSLVIGAVRLYNNSGTHGVGLGDQTYPAGQYSLAIGQRVSTGTAAINSITLGCGVTNGPVLSNITPFSFAVGFNSTIPTFYVGKASGVGTIGKVGIGTTAPHCQFDIVASTNTDGFCVTTNFNIPYGYGIWTKVTGNPLTKAIAVVDQNSNDQFLVYGDGTVFAREFKVTQGTFNHPDYVFENNYNLMPIDSLSLFVKTNKHLPGVPSAEDVKKNNGINLGEMTEANLEKTEELYLYVLQLHDELALLKEQNQLLQSQIDELKKK